MKSERASFLRSFFDRLEHDEIFWCVSRNATEVFDSISSDVDLVVLRQDLAKTEKLIIQVASEHGYKLALRTRFTNLCLLFWSPGADFVRIDLDTSIRWRCFEVISARELLRDRKIQNGVYIPSALGEAMVLSAKVAWMGKLTERYATRLERLHVESLNVRHQIKNASLIINFARSGNYVGLQRLLFKRVIGNFSFWLSLLASLFDDFKRIVRRLLSPPGVYVTFHGTKPLDWANLSKLLQMGFPVQKSYISTEKIKILRAFSSLFRGGVVLHQSSNNRTQSNDLPRFACWLANPMNRIRIIRAESGAITLHHESSQMITEFADDAESIELKVADFIGEAMTQKYFFDSNANEATR